MVAGLSGALVASGLTWMFTRPPPLPKQFEVTGRVVALTGDRDGVVVALDGGGQGFYAIPPEIQGVELIQPGRHLALEILVGDGVGTFVVSASTA